MQEVIIIPKKIKASVIAPPSKSIAQRMLLATLLKGGTYSISNLGTDRDTQSIIKLLRIFGADISYYGNICSIQIPESYAISSHIMMDESGLALRIVVPMLAAMNQAFTIDGVGSLKGRDMSFFEDELTKLGVTVWSDHGQLPLRIEGTLSPRTIIVDAHNSSQYISGLVYAYAYLHAENVTITIANMVSVDYIDMTIAVLSSFGWNHISRRDNVIIFRSIERNPLITTQVVEGDWSNAAMWLVAGAIAGEVKVTGLDVFSLQGDKHILEVLQDIGCYLSINTDYIQVRRGELRPFYYDATDTPDLVPPLVALASHIDGISVIAGCHRLANKESNRAAVLVEEFAKLGVRIYIQDNELVIYGTGSVEGGTVHSHNDHRIAMALAIAGLQAEDAVVVTNAESVAKSYPTFWAELSQL